MMMILLSIKNLVSTMILLPHSQGTHRRNKFVKEVLCSIDYTFYFNWSLFGDHLQKIQHEHPFSPQLCGKFM